jgi:glycine betaine/choline ABC-type transport system substrate-binding protein
MKPENEVSKVARFALSRSKVTNGFKRQYSSRSDSQEDMSESYKMRAKEQKVERALPPHLQQSNFKLSRKRSEKVMNEHARNDGFRREYRANEKTGRLN